MYSRNIVYIKYLQLYFLMLYGIIGSYYCVDTLLIASILCESVG